jgi:hypothetical protein
MTHQIEAEAKILGGLPVLVIGRVHPAEPDVGCGESAEIEDLQWLSGTPIPTLMWERLSGDDYDACMAALLGERDSYRDEYADYVRDTRRDREMNNA